MKYRIVLLAVFVCLTVRLYANQRIGGNCSQGGKVVTAGLNSTNSALLSFAGATVTVNIHSGGLASIFSDNSGTPLSNPFTAGSDSSFGFYVGNSRVDVVCSGTGLPTVTFSDILANDPASPLGCLSVPTFVGDVTSAGGSCTLTLPNIATPGTGLKTTINAKGQVTGVATAASTDLSDTSVIARLNAAANFGTNPITGGAITGTTGTFSGAITDAGETASGEVAPSSTGIQLGDTSHRWDAFVRNLDVSNSVTSLTIGTLTVTGNETVAGTFGVTGAFTGSTGTFSSTLGVSSAFTAQSMNDWLWVGASPAYANEAAAVTAAGSTNKTIIASRSSYAGVDCGAYQSNIINLDFRGQTAPCNTNNTLAFNNNDGIVYSGLRLNFTANSIPAAGSIVSFWNSTFYTGTGGSMNGALVDGGAATAFINGSWSGGTLSTLRGGEISSSVQSLLGTVTLAEGLAAYVAGIGSSTTNIGTVRGLAGYGCNSQTYGVAPTNCYGGYFLKQQAKAATRNFSIAWEGPGLMVFDTVNSSSAELQAEDNTNTVRTLLKVDSGNNTILQAVNAAGLLLRDNGSTTRISIAGSDVRLPTQCTIGNLNAAGSPMALCAITSQKTETGTADANVLTFTPPAVVGSYRVCVEIDVSSATNGVIGWTLNYTDASGSARSAIAESLFQSTIAAPALTFTTNVAADYDSCHTIQVNNAAASIIVGWVGGGVTAAKVSATIERLI